MQGCFFGRDYDAMMSGLKLGKHGYFLLSDEQASNKFTFIERLILGLKRIKHRLLKTAFEKQPLAVIDFSKYKNFEDYFETLPENVRRDIAISKDKRFAFKEFSFDDFIPDFCEINRSQLKRLPDINPWYLQPTEFFKYDGATIPYSKNRYQ